VYDLRDREGKSDDVRGGIREKLVAESRAARKNRCKRRGGEKGGGDLHTKRKDGQGGGTPADLKAAAAFGGKGRDARSAGDLGSHPERRGREGEPRRMKKLR